MDLTQISIDSAIGWIIFVVVVLVCLALYFVAMWFVEKFANGILGGFILTIGGMGLVFGPSYYLIQNNAALPQILMSGAAIFAGCVTVLFGAFSLRNYTDF